MVLGGVRDEPDMVLEAAGGDRRSFERMEGEGWAWGLVPTPVMVDGSGVRESGCCMVD